MKLKQRELSNGSDMLVKCTICGMSIIYKLGSQSQERFHSFLLTAKTLKTTIVVDSDENLIGDVFEEDEKLGLSIK